MLLGEPVVDWIRARRPGTPWRTIAAELRTATNGQIDVTAQTLINWAPDPYPVVRTYETVGAEQAS